MSNFHNLGETLKAMATAAEPGAPAVRALTIGEGVMAGLLRSGNHDGGLHRQPHHEELLIVVEGEAEFRVGDETRHIRPAISCSCPATRFTALSPSSSHLYPSSRSSHRASI